MGQVTSRAGGGGTRTNMQKMLKLVESRGLFYSHPETSC